MATASRLLGGTIVISQRAAASVRGEKSRMKREFHVRFCEGAGVQFPCATRLMLPAVATAIPGHDRKSDGRRCRGRYEESDGCIVPMKPRTTSADGPMTESVEGRRPVEGRVKANACPGHRAGTGMSPTARAHGPELDGPPKPRMPVALDLRQEPGAGKPHAGICAGGGSNSCSYRDPRSMTGSRWISRCST